MTGCSPALPVHDPAEMCSVGNTQTIALLSSISVLGVITAFTVQPPCAFFALPKLNSFYPVSSFSYIYCMMT